MRFGSWCHVNIQHKIKLSDENWEYQYIDRNPIQTQYRLVPLQMFHNTTTPTCVSASGNNDSTAVPPLGLNDCDICGKEFAYMVLMYWFGSF